MRADNRGAQAVSKAQSKVAPRTYEVRPYALIIKMGSRGRILNII